MPNPYNLLCEEARTAILSPSASSRCICWISDESRTHSWACFFVELFRFPLFFVAARQGAETCTALDPFWTNAETHITAHHFSHSLSRVSGRSRSDVARIKMALCPKNKGTPTSRLRDDHPIFKWVYACSKQLATAQSSLLDMPSIFVLCTAECSGELLWAPRSIFGNDPFKQAAIRTILVLRTP